MLAKKRYQQPTPKRTCDAGPVRRIRTGAKHAGTLAAAQIGTGEGSGISCVTEAG